MPNENEAISDEAAERIAAGQREYYRIKKLAEDLGKELTAAKEQIHLNSLTIADLENRMLRATDDRDIALGQRDEAIARAAALTALMGVIAQTVNGFEAPIIIDKKAGEKLANEIEKEMKK